MHFAVKKGRVTSFRATVLTRCGVAPSPYQYYQATYDFPNRKIPRSGIVDTTAKGRNYSTHLRMRIAGGKVTRGYFRYSGPNACSASQTFTAKR